MVVQFLNGYNCAVLNPPAAVVFPGHSTSSWALAVGVFAVGGPFGAVLAGGLVERAGRKTAILSCATCYFAGGVALAAAPSMAALVLARLVIGVASGAASVIVPIYLGELSPPRFRGFFGTCSQFAMVWGILAANLLGIPLSTPDGWRWLFALTPAVAALPLLGAPFLCESPRWLLLRDPMSEEAAELIRRLYAFETEREIELEVGAAVVAVVVRGRESV